MNAIYLLRGWLRSGVVSLRSIQYIVYEFSVTLLLQIIVKVHDFSDKVYKLINIKCRCNITKGTKLVGK